MVSPVPGAHFSTPLLSSIQLFIDVFWCSYLRFFRTNSQVSGLPYDCAGQNFFFKNLSLLFLLYTITVFLINKIFGLRHIWATVKFKHTTVRNMSNTWVSLLEFGNIEKYSNTPECTCKCVCILLPLAIRYQKKFKIFKAHVVCPRMQLRPELHMLKFRHKISAITAHEPSN